MKGATKQVPLVVGWRYRLRNGAVAILTGFKRVTAINARSLKARRIEQAWGTDKLGTPLIWNVATGRHSAGGHVKPGTAALDIVGLIRGERRGVAHTRGRRAGKVASARS